MALIENIYVIRNGLDMAYSNNQSQFYEYGGLFDAFVPDSPVLVPEKYIYFLEQMRERC